ncbi:probable cytochrome P450 12a5, mitochondrial [Hylaeus anthracinus]|uniref:probable cytochrome P450 12a5, mitochondrial n=1 Tax=Hylaeus anthracinus TaxID=313031 RepID=UPI0023B917F9|nr:probable cytochrome P450 12a5, mitochondrial [Hylaeus anthracinus]
MHRLLPKISSFSRRYSVIKATKPLSTTESQKCLNINASDIISASMTQSQASVIAEPLTRADSIPLLDTDSTDVSSAFEVSTAKIEQQIVAERSPLPFEEVPGPAFLKIWEKYWKYVPLLGTQLFSSLLINRFTQGRLTWNRNVTPLKYLFNEYGCIVRINGPLSGDIVMIHRPEHIAEVLKQEGDAPIRSGIDILQHYRLHYRKYRLAGPFSLQGAEWLEMREKVKNEFNEMTSSFFCKIDMACDEMINRMHKIRNQQDEVPRNFHEDITRWAMECFFTTVFNKHVGFLESAGYNSTSEPARIISALATAHKYMSRCETGFQVWRFFMTPFAKNLFEACDVLDGVVGKYVRQAQSKLRSRSSAGGRNEGIEEGSPVLEKFLLNEGIHPDDVSTLLMDMIILGVQATANCEAFLLYHLAKNPRTQRKVYDEIMNVLPSRDSPITEKTLKSMRYLKACLQESLRLRPAFPYFTRLLPKTISLHGYVIPKGTFVIMANQITSQREENYEDPEKFRPERWLTSFSEGNTDFSCLPFGYGARSCLGKNMAETTMMLLTAKLVRQFRIEYDYADIKSRFMMVNVPNKPLRFRFVDRI